jgi:hypothetical protein
LSQTQLPKQASSFERLLHEDWRLQVGDANSMAAIVVTID